MINFLTKFYDSLFLLLCRYRLFYFSDLRVPIATPKTNKKALRIAEKTLSKKAQFLKNKIIQAISTNKKKEKKHAAI